jgi:alanine-glyoxylate transaminase/serine-glyoxylate transaminase/serine-pyruvate transaminase
MIYALREALLLAAEEGLQAVHARHRSVAERLWQGLEAMGAAPLVPTDTRSPTLTTPRIPEGVDDMALRKRLLGDFNIEIAGGFGPLAGRVWRVGLMGYSARQENVDLLLAAMQDIMRSMKTG